MATLTDRGALDGDLPVDCDGVHSIVRGVVFGDQREYLRYVGFHSVALHFEDRQIHGQVDDQFWRTDTVDGPSAGMTQRLHYA